MTARGKRWIAGVAVVLAALAAAVVVYGPALAFLMDLAGYRGAARALVPIRPAPFTTHDTTFATRHDLVTARVYIPAARAAHTVVVFPGIHGGGVDEPRLALFCGRLASTGLRVVCAPLPELRQKGCYEAVFLPLVALVLLAHELGERIRSAIQVFIHLRLKNKQ